ncbi:hypothetical protein TRVA0_011S01794 [Trichomonascus vanleenenianus]|uniref:Lsm12p n=1 Tax=Trichomonascus vanleenenianus TaxID=2268995 RepID=UPI003ECB8065
MSNWSSIDWVIGLKVKVTTILDNVITGKVYAFDAVTNTVTLVEEPEPEATNRLSINPPPVSPSAVKGGPNYRVVKTSFVKDVAVVDKPRAAPKPHGNPKQAFAAAEPAIGYVSVNAAAKRLQESVKVAREAIRTTGVGVSPEGQMVFNAVNKTLPSEWDGKSIIVVDEIRIDPPYVPETCSVGGSKANGNSQALGLVQKIVQSAQQRIAREVKGG